VVEGWKNLVNDCRFLRPDPLPVLLNDHSTFYLTPRVLEKNMIHPKLVP